MRGLNPRRFLPKYRRKRNQHELDLNLRRPLWLHTPGSAHCIALEPTDPRSAPAHTPAPTLHPPRPAFNISSTALSNNFGLFLNSAYLFVTEEPAKDQLPPHITRIHVDRAGDNREHISMYCQASGLPPPDIKWMKDMAPPGRQIDYRYIWVFLFYFNSVLV